MLTFDPPKGSGEGKCFATVMFIYRHWAIMVNSENMSDIVALGKREVYYTKQKPVQLLN